MKTALEELCESTPRLTIKAEFKGEAAHWGEGQLAQHYRVTLFYKGRRMTTDFYQGMAHTKPPSAADVLHCLCSDAAVEILSFEEFCSEFGYDTDSRKAERAYKTCCAIGPKVRKLLGSDFQKFVNAEH